MDEQLGATGFDRAGSLQSCEPWRRWPRKKRQKSKRGKQFRLRCLIEQRVSQEGVLLAWNWRRKWELASSASVRSWLVKPTELSDGVAMPSRDPRAEKSTEGDARGYFGDDSFGTEFNSRRLHQVFSLSQAQLHQSTPPNQISLGSVAFSAWPSIVVGKQPRRPRRPLAFPPWAVVEPPDSATPSAAWQLA